MTHDEHRARHQELHRNGRKGTRMTANLVLFTLSALILVAGTVLAIGKINQ